MDWLDKKISSIEQQLIEVADSLDSKGFHKQADIIDKALQRFAISGPKKVKKYYEECMKSKKHDKEYCARVAWSIYCSNVNPDYEGCTMYGKKWGRPYSAPVSKKKKKKSSVDEEMLYPKLFKKIKENIKG